MRSNRFKTHTQKNDKKKKNRKEYIAMRKKKKKNEKEWGEKKEKRISRCNWKENFLGLINSLKRLDK